MQVYGGHGYIREWGMEQLMRDSRITQLYEGTNGIQALDYIRRKLLGDGGAELSALQAEFSEICDRQSDRPALHALASKVQMRLGEWRELTAEIIAATGRDPREIGAVSVDFLQYSAYVLLAGLWLQAAARAQDALEQGAGEEVSSGQAGQCGFLSAPCVAAGECASGSHSGGADCLMALPESDFAF